MKIVFTIKSLIRPIGGAERSLTELADEMRRRGHQVEIVVNEVAAHYPGARPFYPLDDAIRIHNVAKLPAQDEKRHAKETPASRPATGRSIKQWRKRVTGAIPARVWQLLRTSNTFRNLERHKWMRSRRPVVEDWKAKLEALHPDVVVAFMPRCFTYVAQALRDTQIPLLICYRNDPEVDHRPGRYMNNSYDNAMRRDASRVADKVCVLLENYRSFFPVSIQDKVACIPNIVHPPGTPIDFEQREASASKTIISVGRLAEVKNHELLIRAFARLSPEFTDWRLVIYGKGPLEEHLRKLVSRLGLEDRISLHSPIRDIGSQLDSAQIFAFPSRWEGFSRAHTEAMARGLPSVGLRECRYSNEFLSRSKAGVLAENDPTDFADKLRTLMSDASSRTRMGRKAAEYVAAFEAKEIFDRWEELMIETISESEKTSPALRLSTHRIPPLQLVDKTVR